jgi:hypothetical protein
MILVLYLLIHIYIYINDLSNESEISNDSLSNIVSNTTATNITCTHGYNVVNCIESNINKNLACNSEKYSKEMYVLSDYLDVVEIENINFDIIYIRSRRLEVQNHFTKF